MTKTRFLIHRVLQFRPLQRDRYILIRMLSREITEVGYFLSRRGINLPPEELNAKSWKEAYLKFYTSFSEGRTEQEFRNSLKNIRDLYDGHLQNAREGWKEGGAPRRLVGKYREVFDEFEKLDETELWQRIRGYAVLSFSLAKTERLNKVGNARYFSSEFSGSRNVPARAETTAMNRHGSVVDALKAHVENQYGNDTHAYNTQKMDLAVDVDGKISKIYEVKTSLDSQSVYTAVGQLFMHSAGAVNVEKWIVLPGPVANSELTDCFELLDIRLLCFYGNGETYRFEAR